MDKIKIGIIGGGAAGFFGALAAAETCRDAEITILEKSTRLLTKVRISGGGRCNVTNSLRGVREFTGNYPRGNKELISVFSRFGNKETTDWFESRGVSLKTEQDGRIFPSTDESQTIIDLFLSLSKSFGIRIITSYDVNEIKRTDSGTFIVYDRKKTGYAFDKILYCPGGFLNKENFNCIKSLGHSIVEPVPSLFSFVSENNKLKELPGLSVNNVEVRIKDTKISSRGSILITHQGFSGPAILKLSAFGARVLKDMDYKTLIEIRWTNDTNFLMDFKFEYSERKITKHGLKEIPSRLWETLVLSAGINTEKRWRELSKSELMKLKLILEKDVYEISGKNTNKEEFVTAGGVNLKEVNFKTMESKICKGLFFAGEVLDIDGITGGFNFQSAWSTAYIAGTGMSIE
ncbi:MAG: NAD(P)/FAD-dependent oxidoreductase [Ignavibacteria bacterium]|nr:NAD(P)/FAD-dependent oxidoreductase [Ignavibacteria bacterium]